MYVIYSAYIQRLRRKYDSLRKNKGEELDSFLASPFAYPAVSDVTPLSVPPIIAGIGDSNVLRLQNLSLQKSVDEETKQRLQTEKLLRRASIQRDSAKRKADRKTETYENLRKRHKAMTAQKSYWEAQV